jgi:hypothetical protein
MGGKASPLAQITFEPQMISGKSCVYASRDSMRKLVIASVSVLLVVIAGLCFVRRGKDPIRFEKSENNIAQAPIAKPSSTGMNQSDTKQDFNSLDSFRNEWYSRHLKAMDETSLDSMAGSDETYRFLWLRTFHHPIAIRVWRKAEERNMVFKELDGAGGYDPGKLIANQTRQLGADEWDKFIDLLQQASYWRLPTDSKDGGCDGAQWVLEGKKDNQYHIVDRWSPQSGSYSEACLYLVKLSGQTPQQIY